MGMSFSSKALGIGLVIGLVIGFGIGYLSVPEGVDTTELELQISDLESQVSQLQSQIDELELPLPTSPPSQKVTIGESINYCNQNKILLSFTGIKLTSEWDGWEPEEGRIFCIINITFENIANRDLGSSELGPMRIYGSYYFGYVGSEATVLVADGYEFYDYEGKMPIYEIKIKEKIDTYIYFEMLEELEPKELRIETYGSGELITYVIRLTEG